MTPAQAVTLRLAAQRISASALTRPAEAVACLGAIQAQDYLGALWAVGLRLARATEADVERALADGSVVRTWPMRGTLHFVAAADARWMIELLGPRMVARAAGRFRALGLDEPTLARARREVAMRLDGGKALTREALYGLLERAKIATSGPRGIHILWRLAHDRVLCFGPRAGKQQTFVRFDDWLPHAKTRPREEALAELAARYFTGHGPATAADFAWWSGLTLSEARQAVHLAADRLQRETVHGVAHWLAPAAAPRPAPRARAHLLPAFDEFLVGYTDRSAALEVARAVRVNRGGGILHPTIVVDGRVVGTWKRRLARGEVVFAPDCFEALSAPKARAVSRALERYGEFLGLPARSAP